MMTDNEQIGVNITCKNINDEHGFLFLFYLDAMIVYPGMVCFCESILEEIYIYVTSAREFVRFYGHLLSVGMMDPLF